MMGCRRTVRKDWAHERNDCCDGRWKNSLNLPLCFVLLAQVVVEEQEAGSSHHWMYLLCYFYCRFGQEAP